MKTLTAKTKKLTINIESKVYRGLQKRVGLGNIGRFLSNLAKPYVTDALETGYKAMAGDHNREMEIKEWEGLLIKDFKI